MEFIIAIVSVVFGVLMGVWAMQNRQKLLQNQVENLQSQMQHVKDEAQEKMETVLAEKDKACENMVEAKDKACNNLIDAQDKRHQENIAAQEKRHQQAIEAQEKNHQQTLEAQEKRHKEAMAAQEKRLQDALSAQQSRFNETMQKVTAQVKSATEEMLKKRQEEFAVASNENIGQIVNPLKETIDKMKEQGVLGRRYFYPLISSFSTYRGLPSAAPENLPQANQMADSVICCEPQREDIVKVMKTALTDAFQEKAKHPCEYPSFIEMAISLVCHHLILCTLLI